MSLTTRVDSRAWLGNRPLSGGSVIRESPTCDHSSIFITDSDGREWSAQPDR